MTSLPARQPDALAERLEAALAKAAPLLEAGHRCNRPNPRIEGERVVGFVMPESIAELSAGLLMLDALVEAVNALPQLLADRKADRARSEEQAREIEALEESGGKLTDALATAEACALNLSGLLDDANERIEELERKFAHINRLLSPGYERTFDDLIRDVGYATDIARSALQGTKP